jgi:hypothetical protein
VAIDGKVETGLGRDREVPAVVRRLHLQRLRRRRDRIGQLVCLATTSALFLGQTFVGYETEDALETAARHGFHRNPVGPLRVWLP